MLARSTTVDGRPESVDAGVTHVREHVLPAVLGTDGCIGLSVLVDASAGSCVLTTAWRTGQALRAATPQLRPHVEKVADLLGGQPEDEEWEIAVFHRGRPAPPGACVRTVRVQVGGGQVDHAAALYRMVLLPQVEEFDGFCSASLLVDRTMGHTVASVTFESREAMRRTRSLAAVVREEGSASGEILDVAEFDLAVAHLHVPELV